jgi:DNA uptake protein ComE-like DNA-binding protein
VITYAQLVKADPGMWLSARDEWNRLSHGLLTASQDLDRCSGQLSGGGVRSWSGDANVRALATVGGIQNGILAGQIETGAVAQVLQGMGEALIVAKQTLATAQRLAAENHLTIFPDGKVVRVQANPGPPFLPGAQPASPVPVFDTSLTQVQNLITEALREANEADQRLGARLHSLAGTATQMDPGHAKDVDLNAATQDELQVITDTIPNGPPSLVAQWWAGLTPPEQVKLGMAAPAKLGTLDGIPPEIQKALHGPGGIDRVALVDYALKHYNDHYDPLFKDDCTDFVSQALLAAGLREQYGDRYDHTKSWYTTDFKTGIGMLDSYNHSRSWGLADGLYRFLVHNNSTEVSMQDARPGDIVFWEEKDPGHPTLPVNKMHHAAVVTAIVDGQVFYSQHSGSIQNASNDVRDPSLEIGDGRQQIHFVRVSQDNARPPYPLS